MAEERTHSLGLMAPGFGIQDGSLEDLGYSPAAPAVNECKNIERAHFVAKFYHFDHVTKQS